MAKRLWQPVVDNFADVQKLVHLAARMDTYDVDRIRGELLRGRRRYYEAELTSQAARVGCPMMAGRLSNSAILAELEQQSQTDATGIVNTYNYDLAIAIQHIRVETPTANRFTYAAKLRGWESNRANWKNPQIAQHTELSARSRAQQDFYSRNAPLMGMAVLEPRTAVCPICQGWINRGEVPIQVAKNNPPPYHNGCPHWFNIKPEKIPMTTCRFLWMGGQ